MVKVSPNLENICRLSAKTQDGKQTFAAGDVIKAINNFATDAIERNQGFKDIDSKSAAIFMKSWKLSWKIIN